MLLFQTRREQLAQDGKEKMVTLIRLCAQRGKTAEALPED